MLKRILFPVLLAVLLTGCGGTRHYLHHDVPAPAGEALAPVALQVGETAKVLKHTQGIAIVGGHVPGLAIEDPTIATVRYGGDGTGDPFDPLLSIVGLRPGTTRASYVNRLGPAPTYVDPATGKLLPHSFLIHVLTPGFPTTSYDFRKAL